MNVLLFAATPVSAQCGNYFKTNYTGIHKFNSLSSSEIYKDDWTGDGKTDIWTFKRINTTYDVVIYPSKPTGYWDFDNPIIYTTTIANLNSSQTPPVVMDFDSDGRKDLFYRSDADLRLYRNNGTSALVPAAPVTDPDTGSTGGQLGFIDVNGDNLFDRVYTLFFGSSPNASYEIRYQLQNPDGSFGARTIINTSSISSNKRLGDFNGDGRTDILYSGVLNNQHVYVLIKNLGSGNFQANAPVVADLFALSQPVYGNPVGDFNNDGKDDVLSRDAIFYGQADGTFIRAAISTPADFLMPAELNGDNNLDFFEIGSTYYATHLNNGAGGFTRTEYPNIFKIIGNFMFEDFNNDGKDDLYIEPTDSFYVLRNIFGERLAAVSENTCQPFGETKFANFEGNMDADLTVWNSASGNWSSKNARWSPRLDPNTKIFNWGLGVHGDVPALGDFDGDGKTDYSVYRNSTGVWYIFKSSNSSWYVLPFGLPGDIAVPNDYDGGGKTDIAVWRPSDGIWYIWFSETQSFGALHFGASGDKPVPADYDGDGKTDLALYRSSEGNWYYLRSSDLTYVVLHWGIATDIPVPADYDGDGKADVTIYRDGFWWFWRSSNNTYGTLQWGQPGDIPMPTYRNTVSADLVIYRPSTRLWYNFDSSTWGAITVGGSGDVPVRFGLPNN